MLRTTTAHQAAGATASGSDSLEKVRPASDETGRVGEASGYRTGDSRRGRKLLRTVCGQAGAAVLRAACACASEIAFVILTNDVRAHVIDAIECYLVYLAAKLLCHMAG